MVFSVFTKVGTIGINDRRGVVVDASHLSLVNGNDDDHVVLLGQHLHTFGGGSWNLFCNVAPTRILAWAEVRPVEHLLQAEDLNTFRASFINEGKVLLHHGFSNFRYRCVWIIDGIAHLNESALNHSRHCLFSVCARCHPRKSRGGTGDSVWVHLCQHQLLTASDTCGSGAVVIVDNPPECIEIRQSGDFHL